jgi:hypothetical protein
VSLVSKSWQQAVQQSGVCNTAVLINAAAPMARLQSFAQWLPRHAGLVKSLGMQPWWRLSSNEAIEGRPYEAHLAAAQQLLQLSIHAAGAPPAAGDNTRQPTPAAVASAAVAEETAAGCCQRQRGLRLRSFASSLPKAVDMLAALHV